MAKNAKAQGFAKETKPLVIELGAVGGSPKTGQPPRAYLKSVQFDDPRTGFWFGPRMKVMVAVNVSERTVRPFVYSPGANDDHTPLVSVNVLSGVSTAESVYAFDVTPAGNPIQFVFDPADFLDGAREKPAPQVSVGDVTTDVDEGLIEKPEEEAPKAEEKPKKKKTTKAPEPEPEPEPEPAEDENDSTQQEEDEDDDNGEEENDEEAGGEEDDEEGGAEDGDAEDQEDDEDAGGEEDEDAEQSGNDPRQELMTCDRASLEEYAEGMGVKFDPKVSDARLRMTLIAQAIKDGTIEDGFGVPDLEPKTGKNSKPLGKSGKK